MHYYIIRYKAGFYEYKMSKSFDELILNLKNLDCFTNVEEIKLIL